MTDFIRKTKRMFRGVFREKKVFDYGYSTGEMGRTYIDPESNFSYDYVAFVVRSVVIQAYKDLTNHYMGLGYSVREAKEGADKLISSRLDPRAKEAEKNENLVRVFYKTVEAMYKEMDLALPKINFHYYSPDVMHTK